MIKFLLKFVFLAILSFLFWSISKMEIPIDWKFVVNILKFLLFIVGLDLLFDLLTTIYRRSKNLPRDKKDNITVGLKNLYYFIVFIGLVLLTLSFLNIDLKTVFTTLSIVAAAIAIVSKDFLSALLGGFIITFSKELSIGDEVKIGEHKGKIIDINLTKINIKTEDDDIIFIPNDKAYNSEIINFTKVDNKKVNIRFALPITTVGSVETLEKDLIDALEEYKGHINQDSYNLKITQVEKDGISFIFQYILEKNNQDIERQIRKKTIRKVINRLASKMESLKMEE